mmetsp:Transcript_13304/g.20878  ORF Transcript_13304/g.20878 Transcript_13304/m.20878 type:complete len:80 (-) Transcript_13304:11-250(-)
MDLFGGCCNLQKTSQEPGLDTIVQAKEPGGPSSPGQPNPSAAQGTNPLAGSQGAEAQGSVEGPDPNPLSPPPQALNPEP